LITVECSENKAREAKQSLEQSGAEEVKEH